MDEVSNPTRFRADPKRIRVSVRRFPDGWRATVSLVGFDRQITVQNVDPGRAVMKALWQVQTWPGVDIDMESLYVHPQRPRRQ
jgi:hypothetical protein